jgi:hypothetical protein
MRYRYLRIAFSAVCGVVCLLLIALWVRTYFSCDKVQGPLSATKGFSVTSRRSALGLCVFPANAVPWMVLNFPSDYPPTVKPVATALGFGLIQDDAKGLLGFRIPYWFPVLVTAAIGIFVAAPWLPRRFSLRALLIATTLVAVVLGLIVWLR